MPNILKRLEIGKTYGCYTVLAEELRTNSKGRNSYWYYTRCECGNEAWVIRGTVEKNTGHCIACCVRKHGKSHTRLAYIRNSMVQRCYNPNDKRYPCYGARGIRVCDEWRNDAASFYKWAEENGYKDKQGLSIDRIDNDGMYCPENCRWVPRKENAPERIRRYIVIDGVKKHVAEWCRKAGMNNSTGLTILHRSGEQMFIKRIKELLDEQKHG